jgi:hypothetical protein
MEYVLPDRMWILLPEFPEASTRSNVVSVIVPPFVSGGLFAFPEITPPRTYAPLAELLELNSITNFPVNRLLGGALAVTVTICVSVFVGSDVDAAVIVTAPPVGITVGAVYEVAEPLAVCVGENAPQLPGLEHVTDQSTPALAVSLVTAAISEALWFSMIVLFATFCVIFKEIGATIVTPTEIVALGVATACATIDTPRLVEFAGRTGGAVKTVGAPLAVCEGLNVPHGGVAQLTDQMTPEFVGSFCTTAMMLAVALVNILLGGV